MTNKLRKTEPSSTWAARQNNLVVFGASSETGYGTTGYDPEQPNHYDETRYGWVSRVARNAKAEWGTQTHVFAHGGSTQADFLPEVPNPGGRYWDVTETALDQLDDIDPDMVILGGAGANEYVANIGPGTYEQNLREVIRRIREAKPGVDILLVTYPDIQWPESNRPWQDYARITDRVARETGTGLIDLRQYLDGPNNTGAAGIWHSDGAHLLDAGQASVSSALWTLLWTQAMFG